MEDLNLTLRQEVMLTLAGFIVPGLLNRGYEVDVVHRAAIKIARNLIAEISEPEGDDIP